MKNDLKLIFTLLSSFFILAFSAQNEATKWQFGQYAGLDFSTNPPTNTSNGSINTTAGCASIADGAGNLLFYTNGATVWNQNHAIMANGTGLTGNSSATQSSIIIKKPGSSSIYYVFTTGNLGGFAYSEIDMTLASGAGSVTVKNTTLVSSYLCMKVAAVKHCNGNDIWVVSRDSYYSILSGTTTVPPPVSFNSFLVTSSGVNPVPVLSPANMYTWNNGFSTWTNYDYGCMKISPNGTKIGLAVYGNWNSLNTNTAVTSAFELYDFNASTGAVTNSLGLNPVVWNNINGGNYAYGCEFSPDGTKFYGSSPYYNSLNNWLIPGIAQWDLCAGSPSAIIASQYTVANSFTANVNTNNNQYASMQVAPDGKIYVARAGYQALSVINNPNLPGAACNFSNAVIPLAPRTGYYGLPNFMSSFLYQPQPLQPFTYTVNPATSCLTASFTAPTSPTFVCTGNSLSGFVWLFGDPSSGAANTSTLSNPIHNYPVPGTYTAKLVYNYTCGSDTITLPVSIIGASLTVTTASITCASLGSATVVAAGGIGPYSYTWTPTAQTTSVATGLNPGTYSITVVDNGGNCAFTATTAFTSLVPFTGLVSNSPSIACNGVNTATANIPVSGGSGNNIYSWVSPVGTQTTATAVGLGAGIHTITVTDALTFCNLTQFFVITQPPALTLNITPSTPTTCANGSISFTAANSGGTPGPGAGYTYTWTGGPPTNTFVTSQAIAGNYVYTVTSQDGSNCFSNKTVSVSFIVNPVLSAPSVSICPLKTGTLVASGASTYTWNPSGLSGNTFTDNPLVTTIYTVTGSALGCTSAPQTATIFLRPIPSPTITSNSPVCNGKSLNLSGSGGVSYLWTGPVFFNSTLQNPSVNPAAPNNSGVYNLTVTAANSCTAAMSTTLTVHPSPTVSASGSTVCVTQTLNLFSNTFAGSTFLWKGPNNFTSAVQNPSIVTPATVMSGIYNLTVTSTQGCTNTASANAQVVPMPVPAITANYSAMCVGSSLVLSGSGGNTYAWNGPNAFNNNQQNTGITNIPVTAAGIYTLVVTTGPCVISTTKSITVYPLPNPSASSYTACETKSLQLSGTGGGGNIFFWTGPLSFTSAVQNPVVSNASAGNTGLYILTVIDGNNCSASASTFANVLPNPVVSTTGAQVCLGYPAVLTASGAVTYTWQGPSGYSASSSAAAISAANDPLPQSYLVIGTAANSCTSTSVAILETIGIPYPIITATPRACLNSSITLEGFGGNFYSWKGPYNFASSSQKTTFVASNKAYSGTYTLTVTNAAGCKNSTTANVIIEAAPEGDLMSSDVNQCVPYCADFVFNPRNASIVTSAAWQINNVLYSGNSFSYCVANPGNYMVQGTFTNDIGCVGTTTFEIHAYPPPKADFDFFPKQPVEGLDEVSFTNLSTGEQRNKWNWYFGDNNAYKTNTEHVPYIFERAGTYPVTMIVRNKWGCSDTAIKVINVDHNFTIFVPSSFTPNDDNRNDTFEAKGNGINKFSMTIYDRWGETVFHTTDFTKGWDGKFKGSDCKSEVYVWKITAMDIKGTTKNLNGFVTLYR